jgi:hypothetical protein
MTRLLKLWFTEAGSGIRVGLSVSPAVNANGEAVIADRKDGRFFNYASQSRFKLNTH